jgi:hypothetical protein
MSVKDFATLAPGDRRRLEWIFAPIPSKAGRYTLRAKYRNDPASVTAREGGARSAKIEKLVARAHRTVPCELTSNSVSFTWPR